VAELYEHFDTDTNHLGHLTKLKQSGTVYRTIYSDVIKVNINKAFQ
jgi:hypothetical protein